MAVIFFIPIGMPTILTVLLLTYILQYLECEKQLFEMLKRFAWF